MSVAESVDQYSLNQLFEEDIQESSISSSTVSVTPLRYSPIHIESETSHSSTTDPCEDTLSMSIKQTILPKSKCLTGEKIPSQQLIPTTNSTEMETDLCQEDPLSMSLDRPFFLNQNVLQVKRHPAKNLYLQQIQQRWSYAQDSIDLNNCSQRFYIICYR